MKLILQVADFKTRMGSAPLPVDASGLVEDTRIEAALDEATGIIVMHCPFLLNEAGSDLQQPLPNQFAEGLKAVAKDLAAHRLADSVRDDEQARLSYRESIQTLLRLNEQHEVTLMTPTEQCAEVIDGQGEALSSSTLVDEFFGPPTRGIW